MVYVRTCSDKIGLEGEYVRLGNPRTKEENTYIIQSLQDFFNFIINLERLNTCFNNGSQTSGTRELLFSKKINIILY